MKHHSEMRCRKAELWWVRYYSTRLQIVWVEFNTTTGTYCEATIIQDWSLQPTGAKAQWFRSEKDVNAGHIGRNMQLNHEGLIWDSFMEIMEREVGNDNLI